MRISRLHLPALACIALISTTGAFGDIVYDQPPTFPGGSPCPCLDSVNDGFIGSPFAADSFQLAVGTSIDAVDWQGSFLGSSSVALGTVSWSISISSDNSGMPGTTLYSEVLPLASVGATLAGSTSDITNADVNVYDYRAVLPIDFSASAGTTYWFSVIANSVPPFTWTAGSGGDGTSDASGLLELGQIVVGDRAFALESPVPEPSALFPLSLLLMVGITVLKFRRNRSSLSK